MSTSRYCHFVKRAAVRILGSARKRLNAIRMLRETLGSVHCVTLFGVLALAPLTAIADEQCNELQLTQGCSMATLTDFWDDDICAEQIKQVKAILGALNKAVAPKAKLGKFEVKRLSPPTKAGKFQVSYLIGSKPVFSQRLEQRPEISDHFFAASTSRKSSSVLELGYANGQGMVAPCEYEITRTPTQFVARRTSESLAHPAQAGCRFKLEAESGRQVAVAPAQPLYQNGQMQFRISRATQGAELEVRFKPGGRFKPRFSHSEVIRTLNEVAAGARLMQLQQEESLPRVKGWEFVAGTYVATFAVSEAFFSWIGTGFLDFGLDLANAVSDIHPSGSADTTDCAALMQTLAPLN